VLRGSLLRWAALAAAIAAAFVGCGGSGDDDGPASYVGTASNAALYVTWTQSGNAVTGQLTQALAPARPDGQVQTERTSLSGTVSDGAVSLSLAGGSTVTGKLDGNTLALEYPGQDGKVVTIQLHHGDSGEFNSELAALRDRTAATREEADRKAADKQAHDDAAALADSVWGQLNALAQAADDATSSNPDLYESDLDTIRSDLDTVKSSYDVFVSDRQNGYADSFCDDASSLADDVKSMQDDIAAMRRDVRDNTNPKLIDDDINSVRAKFAALEQLDPSLLPAGAPTQHEVDTAIAAARRTVKSAGGANFTAANKLLAQAQALQATAQAACPNG
jgi:hypothetical protein